MEFKKFFIKLWFDSDWSFPPLPPPYPLLSTPVQEVSFFSRTCEQLCKVCGQPCGFCKYPRFLQPVFPRWSGFMSPLLTCCFSCFWDKSKNTILKFIWLRNYRLVWITKNSVIRVSGDCRVSYSWDPKVALMLLLGDIWILFSPESMEEKT